MQTPSAPSPDQAESASLSYKFQRLREKLRQAVTTGELSGKLPGERTLAKRFHVNAKTLSKALTDLAAEGLLDRSIGRGTYVKGSAPAVASSKRWLLLCDTDPMSEEIVERIRKIHPDIEIANDLNVVRPSYINQFSAVVDLSSQTRDGLIRELVVRNVPVVVVGEKPYTFSTHAVQSDYPLTVIMAGRDLMLGGHRRIAALEPRNSSVVARNLRTAATRFAPDAAVDACFPEDVPMMIENGVTAFVCDSCTTAAALRQQLEQLEIAIPNQVSLMTVGNAVCEPPCSGYLVPPEETAAAIVQLLADTQNARPTTIWLAGRFIDRKTVGTIAGVEHEHQMHYRDLAG